MNEKNQNTLCCKLKMFKERPKTKWRQGLTTYHEWLHQVAMCLLELRLADLEWTLDWLIMMDLMTGWLKKKKNSFALLFCLWSLCRSLHFNNTLVVVAKMRKRKKNIREKERHKIKETDTLPCHQPMFLCVCSVEGKGQHRNEGQLKQCCAFVHGRIHNHMQ